MDISTNAKQSSAGPGLELQRAGLARSIPSQGLIGQVERPDVTPNPPSVAPAPCAPPTPLKDLKALQGSLGTSPPLFVPSSTGPAMMSWLF